MDKAEKALIDKIDREIKMLEEAVKLKNKNQTKGGFNILLEESELSFKKDLKEDLIRLIENG